MLKIICTRFIYILLREPLALHCATILQTHNPTLPRTNQVLNKSIRLFSNTRETLNNIPVVLVTMRSKEGHNKVDISLIFTNQCKNGST